MGALVFGIIHAVFDDPEETPKETEAVLGGGLAGVEQTKALRRLMEQFSFSKCNKRFVKQNQGFADF